MSRFGYSRQELFMTLPRLARFDPEAAERILGELRDEVAGQPFEELRQLRDEAAFRDQTGNKAEAIRLSEQVVARCRAGQGSAADVRWELASLVTRRLATDDPAEHARAEHEIAELSGGPADSSLATALLARASARLRIAGVAPAIDRPLTATQRAVALESWRDLERAESCRLSADEQGTPLLARVALCRVLSRDDEGLRASGAAIEHFRARLPATALSPTQWSDRLVSLQSLYGYRVAVLLRAQPPRVREAFECADLGRAQAIRQQLAWTTGESSPAEDTAPPAYPDLLALLARERAALVMFDVGSSSSWAFVVDPAEPEPARFPLALRRSELAKLLPAKQEAPSARRRLFGALPILSEALAAPLQSVAGRYELIYLSPSSELATVPFAALTLDGGEFVAEHCATAYAPSTSILQWCIARRRRLPVREFLAFGAGGTNDENGAEISFAAQARAIADRVARVPGINSRLLPEGTTADELLDAALAASIVHLECHGYLDSTVSSILSSYLVLAEKPEVQLHAQQVADRRGQIPAELVFLDACLSGTFTAAMKNEVGGFWQAFLVAGASTLVATLTPVDPRHATELVTGFYDHWLGHGLGRAQALRAAQREMLAAGRGPEDWATHILIGDGG